MRKSQICNVGFKEDQDDCPYIKPYIIELKSKLLLFSQAQLSYQMYAVRCGRMHLRKKTLYEIYLPRLQ